MSKLLQGFCPQLRMSFMLCSTLLLQDAALAPLLNLASEDLQSLSLYECSLCSVGDLPSPQRLASLTALTRLELLWFWKEEPKLAALRSLLLQELVLINCPGIEQKLFTPGALTALRKLHIENGQCIALGKFRVSNDPLLDEERDELEATGKVVFQLDELSQISGLCNLFVAGMRQGLREWDAAALPEGTMVSKRARHRCPLHLMKVWTKPRS